MPGMETIHTGWKAKYFRCIYVQSSYFVAPGGDLQGCFQALDAMLLGEGGLPPPLITATKPTHLHGHTTSSNPLPPFRPDAYTLAAVLTAVQQSHKSGRIASPVEALRLALHVWQLIIPRLPRGQRPGLHNFTLMAGILGLSATKNQKRFSLPSPRGLHKNAKSLPVSNFIEVGRSGWVEGCLNTLPSDSCQLQSIRWV